MTTSDCTIKSHDDIEPDYESWVEPTYTLDSAATYADLVKSIVSPIQKLEADIDTGWVIIRHHKNSAALEGYVDALYDTRTGIFEDRWMTFHTEFGLFSILHRSAIKGAADRVLIYTCKIQSPLGPMDWNKIIGSSGQELSEDDLVSPEDQEYYAPLVDA